MITTDYSFPLPCVSAATVQLSMVEELANSMERNHVVKDADATSQPVSTNVSSGVYCIWMYGASPSETPFCSPSAFLALPPTLKQGQRLSCKLPKKS